MFKTLAVCLLAMMWPLAAFATVGSNTAWEVRTTGTDNNGGCFDPSVTSPGTDYSQQNAAQVTYTDLVIGATNTQLTSAGNAFTSVHVGNCIHVTGGTGFTARWYEVMSVASGVATMDRAVGTAASTGGTGNLGGALGFYVTALNACFGGNTIWVKSGTYTQTTTLAVTNANLASGASVIVAGYGTTRGDNAAQPLITTSTNSVQMLLYQTGGGVNWRLVIYNMAFSNTAATRGYGIANWTGGGQGYLLLNNCTLTGFTQAIESDNTGAHGFFIYFMIYKTEIANSTGVGIYAPVASNSTSSDIIDSYIHDNGSDGVQTNGLFKIIRSIFYHNGGAGWNQTTGTASALSIFDSTFANNTGSGVVNVTTQLAIQNSIFYANGAYGIDNGATSVVPFLADTNAFGANVTAAYRGLTTSSVTSTITLTANPFVNSGAGNFALNTTSGGGALLKTTGAPGTFPGGTSVGYLDLGAVQTSGGSSGSSAGGAFTFVQ